jgi:hypothetical protein
LHLIRCKGPNVFIINLRGIILGFGLRGIIIGLKGILIGLRGKIIGSRV